MWLPRHVFNMSRNDKVVWVGDKGIWILFTAIAEINNWILNYFGVRLKDKQTCLRQACDDRKGFGL